MLRKMEQAKSPMIVLCLLSSILFVAAIAETSDSCEDSFFWCPAFKSQCDSSSFIRANCKYSCQTCFPNVDLCRSLNCSQRCITDDDDPNSGRCDCVEGYALDDDQRTCRDIDECFETHDICSSSDRPYCQNFKGSHECVSCQNLNLQTWTYFGRNDCCLRNPSTSCGKQTIGRGRIIFSPEEIIVSSWPWTVYIRIGDRICAGALLTTNYVLSSAQCFGSTFDVRRIAILAGAYDVKDTSNIHVQNFRARQINLHPDADLALIMLDRPTISSIFVSTICLPHGEEPVSGSTCYASEYGNTGILRELPLKITPCNYGIENNGSAANSTKSICVQGYPTGDKESQQGNPGGPLVCQRCNNCDWYLAGVSSSIRGLEEYTAYTNVIKYEEWITTHTGQEFRQESCVSPTWNEWSSWGECSSACGLGRSRRSRSCINGSTGVVGCSGVGVEERACKGETCYEIDDDLEDML